MNKYERDDYFTSGELASLYKIPKQTLLYYDRIGLLKPEFIGSNGYRHYNITQYLTLEIILNLRKLDIPIIEIKSYIANRSPENFLKLIEKKDQECQKNIADLQKVHRSLSLVKENTLRINKVIFDQIFLTYEPAKTLCLTLINEKQKGKNIIKMIARHVYKVFSKDQFKEKNVGWIINKKDFFSGIYNKSTAFYSVYDQNCLPLKPPLSIRPAGLYLTLTVKGTYYQNAPQAMLKLQKFMQVNNMYPVSNIFVIPLENHWLTAHTKEYINKIILQVDNIC
ncbi:MerR family transcriptional regulator [Pectinatus sottacetonis]|uniref:MerR family transcriptional regulator n=1 Tax=Pectinatus sottacetonis TaxID=1002795 RepID=UPI0018C53C8A|nr:MerR family transcriptional regulator [Pectinatus sottacetonis]